MKRKETAGLVIAAAALILMAYIESVLAPSYVPKTACKLVLFGGSILLYRHISGERLKELLYLGKMKPAKLLYILMGAAFAGIVLMYFLLRGAMDLNGIRDSLMQKEQLTKQNCLFIFAYIILVNSLLEEAFFRGFLAGLFEKMHCPRLSYGVSGLAFALYHVGMVSGWFNIWLFLLCIGGLALVGMTLQYISRYYGSLRASWLIHGCANLAINTIGAFLIFGL